MLIDSQRQTYTVEQWDSELGWITIETGLSLIDAEELADEDTLTTRIVED